nr:phage tail protein [uncultured Mediterranean phage uvMED]BAR23021.1 phage tail protein [uncultured Mediterranean phage uvMED]BAR23122.1 phage tail protein [uncultured Mediterranean phage uvMED]BAR23275.1 phage tail protein [uncultured Mediterranean phage uvMED]
MALNSKTTLKIIDLIGEGPIKGIQGREGVYLNETSSVDKGVQRSDFERRKGQLKQERLSDSKTTSILQNVGKSAGENVGKSYSETTNEEGDVDKKDYGAGQVIATVTDLEAEFVQLVFSVPALYSTAVEGLARGQLFAARIRYQIEIQSIGSACGYVKVYPEPKVIEGISTSSYQFKTPKINFDDELPGQLGPWNIKVSKLEFDDPEDAFEIKRSDLEDLPKKGTPLQQGRRDLLRWESIVIHKTTRVNYRGSAVAALSIDAEQFGTLPARAYDVKGLEVQIPKTASVSKDGYLEFNGRPFNGQLQEQKQWTTCPVCCFYDMLVNKRYGAGDFIDADNISWVDLIGISKYCNDLIDLPDGSSEPRFAINTVISSQADAYSVIQDLASVFRGMVFWKSDTIQLAADHGNLDGSDLSPIHVFTNSNVVGGGFVYSGSSLKTRSTRIVARYNDPSNFYKPNYIIVEDRSAISKYGLQTREIVAFGCTSKTQAQRMAKWMMASEELEGETITFSVGLEGLNVLPGQIFAVSDAMRQGARLAGRIVGATRSKIIADQNVSSPTGTNDQLTVVLPDGRVQVRAATCDGTSTITVSPEFDEPPADNAVWTITDTSVANQKFRCLSVAEGEDGAYSITGVQHVDNIYDVAEGKASSLDFPDITLFDEAPAAPENVSIRFLDISKSRNRFSRINVSWSRGTDLRAVRYQVDYKIGQSGNFKTVNTTNTSIDIDDTVTAGQEVTVRIYAIGPEPDNKKTVPVKVAQIAPQQFISSINEVGGVVSNLPPDPVDVTLEPAGKDQVVLRWASTANGQALDEFVAVIRHSAKTDGRGEWYKSNLLRKVEARTTYALLPLMEGEYFVKFENDQGVRSANAVSAVIDLPDQIPLYNYESLQLGANSFPGVKDGVYYDDGFDGLVLDGDALFDDEVDNLDALTANIDSIFGTQRTSGTYYFAMGFDFGAKYSPLFKRILDSNGAYRANTFDDRLDLIDTWSDFDGDIADDIDVQVYLRTAVVGEDADFNNPFRTYVNDSSESLLVLEDESSVLLETGDAFANPSDLIYGPWVPLENTNYAGRHFQFKAVLTAESADQTPVVESLGIDVKFETRTENSEIFTSSTFSAIDVPFEYPFYTDEDTKPSVGIIAYDMQPGDYFVLGEPSSQGFRIEFFGTFDGDERIARRFRYTAVGYGAKQS